MERDKTKNVGVMSMEQEEAQRKFDELRARFSPRIKELFMPVDKCDLYQRQSLWSHNNWHESREIVNKAKRLFSPSSRGM